MSQRIRSTLLAAWLMLPGLVACAPPFVPIEKSTPTPFVMPTHEMKMALPVGWMSEYYGPMVGYFFFTVHGRELEEIWIRRFPKSWIVKGTNRAVAADMTVQDVAKLSVDSRRLDDGVGAFELVSNRPAEVGGRDCFRLDYRHRNEIGLRKRTVEYGCPVGDWLYRFEFMAPEQHYFERYLSDFEAAVGTIEFTVPGA
jgi:hypothetical protein